MRVIIQPTHGLCNRLRVVFSYYRYAQDHDQPLVVYWDPCRECEGFFLDYFEPLPGATFYREKPAKGVVVNYRGYEWHPEYNPYSAFIYDGLSLNMRMQSVQSRLWARLGDPRTMVALHVRRTDHTSHALSHNQFTTEEDFFRYVDLYPQHNVLLATDNAATQQTFLERYGSRRVLCGTLIQPSDRLRQTSVEEAVRDLFACVQAAHFKGSGWSSFSDLIHQLRLYHCPGPCKPRGLSVHQEAQRIVQGQGEDAGGAIP